MNKFEFVKDGGGVYDDVDLDASYFGQMNLDALLDVMERQIHFAQTMNKLRFTTIHISRYGFSSQDMDEASEFFLQWVRLPNDNSWRIEGQKRQIVNNIASLYGNLYVFRHPRGVRHLRPSSYILAGGNAGNYHTKNKKVTV